MTLNLKIIATQNDISDEILCRLMRLEVRSQAELGHDALEFSIVSHDVELPRSGIDLDLYLTNEQIPDSSLYHPSNDSNTAYLGKFTVTEVTHVEDSEAENPSYAHLLTISTEPTGAALMSRIRKNRIWDNKSYGQILAQIAIEHDLISKISTDLDTVELETLTQENEDDLSFLRKIAEKIDATITVSNGFLTSVPRGSGQTVSGQYLPMTDIPAHHVKRLEVSHPNDALYDSVEVWWIQPETGEKVKERIGTGSLPYMISTVYRNQAIARQIAQAKFNALKRRQKLLSLEFFDSWLDLQIGGQVSIKNHIEETDEQWSVTKICHIFDTDSFKTHIEAEQINF